MDPWDNIPVVSSGNGLNKQRAEEGSHLHHFFRGKDSDGNYVFLYQGKFNVPVRNIPSSKNISLDNQIISDGLNQLVFILRDVELKSLFRHLSLDLISAAGKISQTDDQAIADIILTRFMRWQSLLGRAKSEILSDSQVLGLLGELTILKRVFIPNCGAQDGVEAWCGPLGEEQDFAFNRRLLEVKSQAISKDAKILISSAEQLDDVSGQVFLCHQTFSKTDQATGQGETLNEIVVSIRNTLSEQSLTLDGFETRLIEVGYCTRTEYDTPKFIQGNLDFYRVFGDFPRIVPSQLTPGIVSVRYAIQLEQCKQFQIPEEELIKIFFHE
ncbi:MAG: PD-(D/E)XK motif protein [Rhizobiaceae bacterium]|nr:PD-(D/E)XK motif protein [Rhizobiaceae bacterium]